MNSLAVRGARILVTGGLGFIGSSLVIDLVKKGAHVTIVDNLTPQQGGNIYNILPVKDRVVVNYSDIRDELAVNQLIKDQDIVFHLARQTDHILSQQDPYPDIDINVRGTAVLLEACKKYNPTIRFIYIGTRGQYGHAITLPVKETAPTNPRGIYELTNLAAEKMVQIYHDVHGIRSVMLRLTNVYGPRSQMKHDHYGVVNWFIRLALDDQVIPVFGDGKLRRDFLYIDDAIQAIERCALCDRCYGEVINVGNASSHTFLQLVKSIVEHAHTGSWKFAPFTKERKAQEPGDFRSDITKIRTLTSWKPTTSLDAGIKKTLIFYKKYRANYW